MLILRQVDNEIEAEYTRQRFERRKLTRYALLPSPLSFSSVLSSPSFPPIFSFIPNLTEHSLVLPHPNIFLSPIFREAQKKAKKKVQPGTTLMRFMQEKEYWEKFVDALHIGDFADLPPKKEISFTIQTSSYELINPNY